MRPGSNDPFDVHFGTIIHTKRARAIETHTHIAVLPRVESRLQVSKMTSDSEPDVRNDNDTDYI